MPVVPPDELPSPLHSAFAMHARRDPLAERWQAIHIGAARLARLAGLGPASDMPVSQRAQEEILRDAALIRALESTSAWQRELVCQALEDIEAMMRSGMMALDVLTARGRDVTIPALALWREVDAARRSVMAMLAAAGRLEGVPVP
jgi:hypothetical protein